MHTRPFLPETKCSPQILECLLGIQSWVFLCLLSTGKEGKRKNPIPGFSLWRLQQSTTLQLTGIVQLLPTKGRNFTPTQWTHLGANELNVHARIMYIYTY